MKKILLTAICAVSLSAYALPTYEPFTEYAGQLASNPTNLVVTSAANVPVGTNADSAISNCLDLATGGLIAPSGETWGALYFSGGGGGGTTTSIPLHGLDVAVISNSTIFTAANLASLLPSTFPGFPAVGGGITNIVENPAQPLIWNVTNFSASNYCGNSAVLLFGNDFIRPSSGTKTLYVSYLFAVSQLGQLGTGNDGRYLAFLSSSNLSEGFVNGSPVPGAAYTNFFLFFDTFNGGTAGGVHYASHGLIKGGSGAFIGPCDSDTGKEFTGTPFSTAFNNTPNFVVGAYVMNASGKDTNIVWVNPATSGFGGTRPPASPIFATNLISSNLTDIGGLCLIDRAGSGQAGGVGTNYVANLIIGSTWSYVTGGPEFTTEPVASTSVNAGGNVSLTGVATAAGQTVNYQWQKVTGGVTNNVNNGAGGAGGTATVTGATTSTLTLTGFSSGDAGTYQLLAVASSTGFNFTSTTASLALSDPQIAADPTNTTANFGGTATFTAKATTTSPPLTFQWFKGATPIANGTQPGGSTASGAAGTAGGSSPFTLTLTLSGVTYQDDGGYSLVVSNSGGFSASSTAATLTVNDPFISVQPTSPAVAAGGNASFTVTANGSPTLTYQWFENGIQLVDGNPTATGAAIVSGSQTATLTLTGVQDADDGNYTCTATSSGSGASANSAAAALVVQDALSISVPLRSLTERVGDHTAFSVGVTGGGPSYSWTFNGNPIPGATGSSLVLTNIQTGSNGTYAVSMQNLVTITPIVSSATLTVINSSILNVSSANLVVARVGDGAQALSATTGNTVYLDQITTAGSYVDTIQVPDEGTGKAYGTGSTNSASMPFGSPALIVAGAGSDGENEAMLSLSANQEYIAFAGYCQAYPYSGISTVNTPNTTPSSWRGLGTVDAFGFYNLAYTNSGLYSAGNALIRDVYTLEGTNFWTTGAASAGTVKFVNSGPAGAAYANGSGVPSSSGVSANGGATIQVVNGALPAAGFSTNNNLIFSEDGVGPNNGLYIASGTPEPSAGNIAFSLLLNTTGLPADFAFSPDNLTVYVADSAVFTGTGPGNGGIERWDSTGSGGWTFSYVLPVMPGGLTNGAQGLTVDFSASPTWGSGVTGAKIYATSTGPTTNSVVMLVDNGNTSTPTVLATAGPNQAFRGVRFGPTLILPAIVTAPLSQTNFPANSVTFTVVASGSGPLTYQWSYNSTPISGATGTSFTTNNISLASGGNYSVTVSNPNGQTASATAVLTVTAGSPTIVPATLPNYTETAGDHVGWGPTVNGTLPVTNYWYFGSVSPANLIQSNVSAAPIATLSLSDIQTSSNGTYILVTSNQFGHATASGTLTVTTSPQAISTANLVVARIGDGVQTLSVATGNTLYLDQYTTSGGYVNTIQVPDEGTGQPYGTGGGNSASMPFGSPALLLAGSGSDAAFEALLTLSPAGPNGQTLTFAGYCEPYPFPGPDITVGAGGGANWRGVSEVDGYGHYSLAYTNTGLYSGGNHQIHGAIDIDGSGTNFYTTGQAGSGFGIKYVNTDFQPASGNGIASVAGSFSGTHVARIVNGSLVFSDAAASPVGIYGVSGLPTTTATASLLLAETNSPVDFAVSPDGSTVYIADNGTFEGTSAQLGGIQRWDGTAPNSYTYSYTLGTGTSAGARGLTVDFSANVTWGAGVLGAKLYATTAEASGNRLIEITDNGASSSATTLSTAATGQILSGVRFGPATVAAVVNASPQNESAYAGTSATFSGTLNGSQPLTYQWSFQANCSGAFNPILNATNATLTVSNISGANVGCYEVTITNPGGSQTSAPASLTLLPPPQFTSETFLGVGVGFQMNFMGGAGFGYTIWTTTNLTLAPIQSTWTKLTTGTFSGGTDSFTDPNGGVNPDQYYIISVP